MSETGTEDWGLEDTSAKDDGNWSTADQKDDKLQTPAEGQKIEKEANEMAAQSSTGPTAQQDSSPKTAPASSPSGGSGEYKETTVFSLSRGNDLVTRYTSKRGKSRGRGQRSGGFSHVGGLSSTGNVASSDKDKTRYAPPKPGSTGITVIEPLEKRLQNQQDNQKENETERSEGQSEATPAGAIPSAKTANSAPAKGKNRPGSGRSPSNKDGTSTGGGGSGGGQTATSKPKRYSSQRQKGW